ncbi:ABC transporter ATP-binding protein [Catenovulum agarivorans]|uniref:ABC transporter ATP-binding protein n=1 Tax=Catenovulum agarivorans TaxID=1172192 RepID=UPI0002D3B58C|nr:ABC transporter ATP-binding protein [Catenovulum agarivorans]
MLIQLHEVTYAYPSNKNKTIIQIKDWQLAQQQKHFLYGPSGSGKSTLLNIVSGVIKPTSGRVEVLNERLDKLKQHKLDKFRAQNIGYIFQKFNLIPYLNAFDNIHLAQYFAANTKKQQANADKTIMDLLEELQVNIDDCQRPVSQLSVGQQQRIGIARAFINQPKLLIADEPTSSLDQDARDSFITLLNKLCANHNCNLLFVSHDMSLQSYFDRTHALNQINLANKD